MQGRGWGYFARPDKYCASHILFWYYSFKNVEEKTNISFSHNYVYNPKMLYYLPDYKNTIPVFKMNKCIRSDFNHYYMNNDSYIFRDNYKYKNRINFTQDFNKEENSEYILWDKVDQIILEKGANSYDYKELRKIFVDDIDDEDEEEKDTQSKGNSHTTLIVIVVILIVLFLIGGIFIFRKIQNKKNETSIDKLNDFPLVE